MNDLLVRGVLQAIDVRFVACRLSASAQEACHRHDLSDGPARYLSEALVGCTLLGSILRYREKLTLQIRGEGALKSLVADVDDQGHVRGMISFSGKPAYDVLARSPGLLVLSKSRPGDLTYQGQCRLGMGCLAADLAYHCSLSDQVESFMDVCFTATEDKGLEAGGLLLQALPGADLDIFEELRRSFEEHRRVISRELIRDPAGFTSHLLRDYEPRVLLEKDVSFGCNCSRERVEAILRALGAEEIESLIHEEHGAEVTCHWCGQRYHLSENELLALLTDFSVN